MDIIIQNRKSILIIVAVLVIVPIAKGLIDLLFNRNRVPWVNHKYPTKQYFFTISENHFYTSLKKVLYYNYGFKYEVYPKVRLADIFNATEKNWVKRLWMRHVDFLIVDKDQSFKPILAIELDWDSHKEYRQYKSDKFKNEVFKDSNLPLIRFNNNISDDWEIIKKNLIQYLWNPTK
jgi:hypothetical protein